MSTRIATEPAGLRKVPRQQRSRALVEAMIEGGARVLEARGWAGFTTNAVATTTGVSIGSVYQYFPDKFALARAVHQRHLDECMAAVQSSLAGQRSADAFADSLVQGLVAAHAGHPRLHRVLLDDVPPQETRNDPSSDFERCYMALFADAVTRFHQGISRDAAHLIGCVVSDAIDGTIHNAVRRETILQADVPRQLTHLVNRYLS